MQTIINKAIEILIDDGGMECIKIALRAAIKITKPNFEITRQTWSYMIREMLLLAKAQKEHVIN